MITLTERAATELKDLISTQKEGAALRIWVEGGGCSGLSYGMSLVEEEPEADDNIYEQAGIRVLVDAISLKFMDGSSVDYVEEVMGGGFKIENPNATSSCGCGSSFQAEGAEGQAGGGCGSGCGCHH